MNQQNLCYSLEAFHDGELQPGKVRAMAAHIKACPSCRAELVRLNALDEILKPRIPAADLAGPVMSRVAAQGHEYARHSSVLDGWWKVPAVALASCAIYVLCVETGLLPARQSPLLAALAARNAAEKIPAMIFGGTRPGQAEMLAMLFEGGKK